MLARSKKTILGIREIPGFTEKKARKLGFVQITGSDLTHSDRSDHICRSTH